MRRFAELRAGDVIAGPGRAGSVRAKREAVHWCRGMRQTDGDLHNGGALRQHCHGPGAARPAALGYFNFRRTDSQVEFTETDSVLPVSA
jgi:hypothetical protein